MLANFFIALFLAIPEPILRIIFFYKRRIIIDNQRLNFQSQVFLSFIEKSLKALGDDPIKIRTEREKNNLKNLSAKPPIKVSTQDHNLFIDGHELILREYIPESIKSKNSMLYFHGGGYVIGSINTHHTWVEYFASKLQMKIYSLNYRLAPEYPFPCALEDANFAFEWIMKKYNCEAKNIILCGDSAGAHLAASLSNYRLDNQYKSSKTQLLIYPMIDPSCNSKSQDLFANGFLLTKESMHRFWSLFRGNISDDENPYFNLMHQEDLSNSLDTLIITAGFDPLRDEAEVYAKKLNRSGVRVKQLHYPDLFHGFVNLTGLRECKTAVDDMIDEMRNFYE